MQCYTQCNRIVCEHTIENINIKHTNANPSQNVYLLLFNVIKRTKRRIDMYSFMSDGVHVENKQRPKKIHPNDEGKQKNAYLYICVCIYTQWYVCAYIVYDTKKKRRK